MTKPTELGEWATEPGQTIEPSSDQKAAGFVEGDKPPARWINWLWNVSHLWHKYLDNLHNETDFLNKNYTWTGDHGFRDGSKFFGVWNALRLCGTSELFYADADGAFAPRSRTVLVALPPMSTISPGSLGSDPRWWGSGGGCSTSTPSDMIRIPLPVPRDATLTGVTIGYLQIGAGGGSPATVEAVYYQAGTDGDTLIGTAGVHSSTGGTEVLSSSGVSRVKTDDQTFYARITSSAGASAASPESLVELSVTYLEAGPRSG